MCHLGKLKMSDQPCPSCVRNTAITTFLVMCETAIKGKLDCKKIEEQIGLGEITTDDFVSQLKEAARDDPDLLASIADIDRMRKAGKIEP